MKTVADYQAAEAAKKARQRANRASRGLIECRVCVSPEAAAFVKDLAARLREPGAAALDATLADMLGVHEQAPAPAVSAPVPPAAPGKPLTFEAKMAEYLASQAAGAPAPAAPVPQAERVLKDPDRPWLGFQQ